MTRRFFRLLMMALAGLPLAPFPLRADAPAAALTKSELVASNVVYLRVGDVGTNLAGSQKKKKGY